MLKEHPAWRLIKEVSILKKFLYAEKAEYNMLSVVKKSLNNSHIQYQLNTHFLVINLHTNCSITLSDSYITTSFSQVYSYNYTNELYYQ